MILFKHTVPEEHVCVTFSGMETCTSWSAATSVNLVYVFFHGCFSLCNQRKTFSLRFNDYVGLLSSWWKWMIWEVLFLKAEIRSESWHNQVHIQLEHMLSPEFYMIFRGNEVLSGVSTRYCVHLKELVDCPMILFKNASTSVQKWENKIKLILLI